MKQNRYTDEEPEDFALDFDYEEEDDFLNDDVCCWDPRYKHGSYCHCKAYQEAYEREQHWFWGNWDLLKFNLRILYVDISDYVQLFLRKRECHKCKKTYRIIRWGKDDKCPNCGTVDLPF